MHDHTRTAPLRREGRSTVMDKVVLSWPSETLNLWSFDCARHERLAFIQSLNNLKKLRRYGQLSYFFNLSIFPFIYVLRFVFTSFNRCQYMVDYIIKSRSEFFLLSREIEDRGEAEVANWANFSFSIHLPIETYFH
jgi:hypothetical protein